MTVKTLPGTGIIWIHRVSFTVGRGFIGHRIATLAGLGFLEVGTVFSTVKGNITACSPNGL